MRETGEFKVDKDLIDALRSGDRQAVEHVYDLCYPAFESYVMGCGGTREEARDTFQEAVLSVWVNVRQDKYELREEAAFRTYILGVCKYKWMNRMRSAQRRKTMYSGEIPELAEVTTDEAYEEKLRQLNAGLGSLGSLCQEILRMFYFEKLSYEEMEERTGKTADSLKNQKYRCINRLREIVLDNEKQHS